LRSPYGYYCTPIINTCQEVFLWYSISTMKFLIPVAVVVFGLAQQPMKSPETKRVPEGASPQIGNQSNHTTNNKQTPNNDIQPKSTQAENGAKNAEVADENIQIQGKLVLFTGLLVLVGAITAGVIGWQSFETRRAANAAIRNIDILVDKERAKLTIQINNLVYQLVGAGGFPATFVTGKIWNYGQSKAILLSAEIGAAVDNSPKPNPKLDIAPIARIPDIITLDSRPDWQAAILPKQLTDADFQAVAEGKMFVRFFALIKYRDIFNIERETSFYRVWKPFNGLRDYGLWEKIGPPSANRET
jgi:hypothetical protein